MKISLIKSYLIPLILLTLSACGTPRIETGRMNARYTTTPTQERLAKGLYWMQWRGMDRKIGRNEVINLLVADTRRAPLDYRFAWFNTPEQRSTLSEVADTALAIAAINAAYFEQLDEGGFVSYHKSNGQVDQVVELPADHVRFWKHQAAFVQTSPGQFAILPGNSRLYDSLPYADVVSSAPMLIDDGVPVGAYFADREADRTGLPREHPDLHQAGLGPRTAFATGEEGRLLLLLTVDGRSETSTGLNAAELTALLQDLGAREAINMDGGGSVTCFVRGATPTGIVNYPSDNRKDDPTRFNHQGQRRIGTALLLVPATEKLRRKMLALPVGKDEDAKDYQDSSNKPRQ